jgi:hypothetical protein
MGNTVNKKSYGKYETKNKIPLDNPLGQMLKYWSDSPQTKGKKKKQIIKYCCFYLEPGTHSQASHFLAKIWIRKGLSLPVTY